MVNQPEISHLTFDEKANKDFSFLKLEALLSMNSEKDSFNDTRCKQLMAEIEGMLHCLNDYRKDLQVQQNINEFYYMQKIQELILLEDQFKESVSRTKTIEERMQMVLDESFLKLKKDMHWLSTRSLKKL